MSRTQILRELTGVKHDMLKPMKVGKDGRVLVEKTTETSSSVSEKLVLSGDTAVSVSDEKEEDPLLKVKNIRKRINGKFIKKEKDLDKDS